MKVSEIAGEVLSLREQAALENEVLKDRLETVLPIVMEREKIDLWLVVCREYNEDPVIMTMLPAPRDVSSAADHSRLPPKGGWAGRTLLF